MGNPTFQQAWSSIDQAADPAYFVRFMDRFYGAEGADDDPDHYRERIALLAVKPGQRLLEVGCGAGGSVRMLARLAGPAGRVVGVDNSATMVAAERRAAGLGLPVEYRVADAHALPFADATFDGCCSGGVFEVLDDPRRALAEMARVAAPGGRVVVNAEDAGTQAVDGPDRTITRRILDYHRDHELNGGIGHQLYGLFKGVGLADITVIPSTWVETEYSPVLRDWLGGIAAAAQAAGAITAAECVAWGEQAEAADRAGRFFSALTFYAVGGRKP